MARFAFLVLVAGVLPLGCGGHTPPAPAPAEARAPAVQPIDPASVERVSPVVARARRQTAGALLVCAYDDATCERNRLEGAIPFSALQAQLPELPRDREIILYCA